MTIALKEYNPNGVDIVDEVIYCSEAKVIGETTYYLGHLNYTTNDSVGGNTSPVYGIWTGAALVGTRLNVDLDGLPNSSTTIGIDKRTGTVYSTTLRTIYIRYRGHDPIKYNDPYTISIPWELEDGFSTGIHYIKLPYFSNWAYASVSINGGLPTADAELYLNVYGNVIFFDLSNLHTSYTVEFDNVMKLPANGLAALGTFDGKGAFDLTVTLFPL